MGRPIARVQTDGAGEKQSHPTATGGEAFPDGSLLELVRDSSEAVGPALLHRDGKRASVAPEMMVRGRRYVPAEIDPTLWRHLRLPSKFITKYSGLTDGYPELLTCFVFASFFVDCMDTGPCVLLQGCADAEAVGLLRLLGWFCRHPVMLTDAGLSVPGCLKATRLICQPGNSLERNLASLQLSGFATFRQNSLHDLSGATAIYVGETELRSPFLDSCLRIPIVPCGVLVSSSDEEREAAALEDIRDQLLSYRLVHFSEVRGNDFDVPEFSGPIRGLARALGA